MRIKFDRYIAERTSEYSPRPWLIRRIADWLGNPGPSRFFVISAEPGGGKTALSGRITLLSRGAGAPTDPPELAALPAAIAAHHFCFAQDAGWIDPLAFSRSISAQLASAYPEFERALRERPEEHGLTINAQQNIFGSVSGEAKVADVTLQLASAHGAFTLEVRQPLVRMYEAGFDRDIFILVDALDEAEKSDGPATIFDLVLLTKELPPRVRFLVTTRPEADILRRLKLQDPERQDLPLSDPSSREESRRDIFRYVTAALARQPALRARVSPQLGETALVDRLCDKADGNFLWTRLVLKMLAQSDQVVTAATLDALPSDLNDFYFDFIEQIAARNRNEWRQKHALLLGTLVVAREELSAEQLAKYGGLDSVAVAQVIRDVSQLLDATQNGEPRYSLYHRSMADFLTDPRASREYYVDAPAAHQRIAAVWKADGGDDYALRNISSHLFALRHEPERLRDLYSLASRSWMERKCTRYGSDASFAVDMALVAEAAAGASPRDWVQELRATSILTTLRSRGAAIPGAALALLARLGEIERVEGYLAVPQDPAARLNATIDIADAIVEQQPVAAAQLLKKAIAAVPADVNTTWGRAILARALAFAGHHGEAVSLLVGIGGLTNGGNAIVIDIARRVAAARRFDLADTLLRLADAYIEDDVREIFIEALIAENRFDDALRWTDGLSSRRRDEWLENIARARLPFGVAEAIATLRGGDRYMQGRLLAAAAVNVPDKTEELIDALPDREDAISTAVHSLISDGLLTAARLVARDDETRNWIEREELRQRARTGSLEEVVKLVERDPDMVLEVVAEERDFLFELLPRVKSQSIDFLRLARLLLDRGKRDAAFRLREFTDDGPLLREIADWAKSAADLETLGQAIEEDPAVNVTAEARAYLAEALAAKGRFADAVRIAMDGRWTDEREALLSILVAASDRPSALVAMRDAGIELNDELLGHAIVDLLRRNETEIARELLLMLAGRPLQLTATVAYEMVRELVRSRLFDELRALSFPHEAAATALGAIALARSGDAVASKEAARARDDFEKAPHPYFIAPVAEALRATGGDAGEFLQRAVHALPAAMWIDPRAVVDIAVATIETIPDPQAAAAILDTFSPIDWPRVLEQLALDDAAAAGIAVSRNLGIDEHTTAGAIDYLVRRCEWRRALEIAAIVKTDWLRKNMVKQVLAAAGVRRELAPAVSFLRTVVPESEVTSVLEELVHDDDPRIVSEVMELTHDDDRRFSTIRALYQGGFFADAARHLGACDAETRRWLGSSMSAVMAGMVGVEAALTFAKSLDEDPEQTEQIVANAARELAEQKKPLLAAELARELSDGWYRSERIGEIAAAGEVDRAVELTQPMRGWYRQDALIKIARAAAPADPEKALAIAGEIEDAPRRAEAIAAVIIALIAAGNVDRALQLAAQPGDHASSASALADIATALFNAGRETDARAMLDRAFHFVESVEDHWSRESALQSFARGALDLNVFDDARRLVALMVSDLRARALFDVAAAYARKGRLDEAAESARAVLAAAEQPPGAEQYQQARAVAMIASLRGGRALREIVDAICAARGERDLVLLLFDLATVLHDAVSWREPAKNRLLVRISDWWRKTVGRRRAVRIARLVRAVAARTKNERLRMRSAGWAALALSYAGLKREARDVCAAVKPETWSPATSEHMLVNCDLGRVYVRIGERERARACAAALVDDLAKIDEYDHLPGMLAFAASFLSELRLPDDVVQQMLDLALTVPQRNSARFTGTLVDAVYRTPDRAAAVGNAAARAAAAAPEEIVGDFFELLVACGVQARDAGLLREAELLAGRIPVEARSLFVVGMRDVAYRDPVAAAGWLDEALKVVEASTHIERRVRSRAMYIETLQLTGRTAEAQAQLGLALTDVRNAGRRELFDLYARIAGTLRSLGDDVFLGCIRGLAETEQWWSHRSMTIG